MLPTNWYVLGLCFTFWLTLTYIDSPKVRDEFRDLPRWATLIGLFILATIWPATLPLFVMTMIKEALK